MSETNCYVHPLCVQLNTWRHMDMKEQSTDRLSIRINSEVKQQASEILEELGLDLSSAVNVFWRQVIPDNGLPFQPNLETMQMVAVDSLLDMIAEAKAEGGNHTLDEIKKRYLK